MSGIRSIIDQVKQKQKGLEKQAEILIEKDKKIILDYVRINQLLELGEDADGEKLTPYSSFTRRVKSREGRNPEIVTLFDEGDFYEGFDLSLIQGDVLNIYSRDIKAPELIEKYGNRIDDLNEGNEEKVETYHLEENLVPWVLEISV